MSDTQESPGLEDLTPEEANRIIHSHRKVRYGKWISTPDMLVVCTSWAVDLGRAMELSTPLRAKSLDRGPIWALTCYVRRGTGI